MSVSTVAPTPFYQDPERLQIGLPQDSSADAGADGAKHLSMFADGDDSPSFSDLLDIINPLQHIPVIGNIYREMTGDQIGVGARLAGGALFGGVIGLVASAVDCMVEEGSGSDVGGHMLALFRDESGSAPTTQLAQDQSTPAANGPATAAAAAPTAPAPDAPAAAGPVIALPDNGGTGAAQAMVFSLDGMETTAASAPVKVASTPAATTAAAAAAPTPLTPDAAPAAAPAAKGLSLGGNGRALHMPQRAAKDGTQALPPVTVPVSNSSARSNVPQTGRSPQAAAVAATAQRAQVSQDSLANHPMAPPTDANGQVASSSDWFTSAWNQALDKYQRANQRNDKGATSTTSTVE